MDLLTLVICAVSLASDAFAMSICKGIAIKKINLKTQLKVGIWYGGFQALMPLIGYILSISFKGYVEDVTHVITFVLLAMIGSNMIKSARNNDECECIDDALDTKNMFVSALATSIDAMAVGVTFSLLQVNILLAIALIGIITFILSTLGVLIGHKFGLKYKSKAEMTGGIMLLLLGIKILLESM